MTALEPDKIILANFLKSIVPMTDEMVVRITQQFKFKEFKKGDYFVKEGKPSNEYLFLESGYMRAFLMDTDGNDVTVNFYSPRAVVFEVSSFFQRVLAQENIKTLSDCKGWAITFEELDRLFHALPEFREFGRAILVKGYVTLKRRTLSMINQTAEKRYAGLLKETPDIFQNAPLKCIASYLGLTDTSLSRIRKDLAKKSFLAK